MVKLANERSRAYPAICLEEADGIIGQIVSRLGPDAISRELLAEILGYSNVYGGPGARKISALTQYGLLKRRTGLYDATPLASRLLRAQDADERQQALQLALNHPTLFKALLDRYEPQGRVPVQLARILALDHGITQKASSAAAEIFMRSARYAGVIASDGTLRIPDEDQPKPDQRPPEGAPVVDAAVAGAEQRFEFLLSGSKIARLWLPMQLTKKDLDIVRRQIDFLEYQVVESESDHG